MKHILSDSCKYFSDFFLKSILVPCLILGLFTTASAQTSPFIQEDGVRKAKFLTVNFKERILDLERGVKTAAISQIDGSFNDLKTFLSGLENSHGEITLRKQIPDAVWGDVWRTNRRTGEAVRIHEWSQLFYLIFPDYVPVDSIVAELRLRPEVDYAHAPVIAVRDATPNDPEYTGAGGQYNLALIEAEKAWDVTKGSSNVIVAIIEVQEDFESGIPNKNHFDLSGKFASGGDNLEQGETPGDHATNVAGIVGAATNNNAGIASLGWNILMRPYRFNGIGSIQEKDQSLTAAIYRALNEGCDVMNCSFGLITGDRYNPCGTCLVTKFAELEDIDDTIDALVDAFAMGVIVVGSAGNHYSEWTGGNCSPCIDLVYQERYPAAFGNVIAVTATDQNDDPIPGYNQGSFIDVAAPGIQVKTTSGNDIITRSGTSFSAPLVAALAGLMKSINPDITPDQAKTIIESTAYDTGDPNYLVGAGRINAYPGTVAHACKNSKEVTMIRKRRMLMTIGFPLRLFLTAYLPTHLILQKRKEYEKSISLFNCSYDEQWVCPESLSQILLSVERWRLLGISSSRGFFCYIPNAKSHRRYPHAK
jgi:subtilisin family serine protease